jgi:carbon-monoxide dehydrogenase large subunit
MHGESGQGANAASFGIGQKVWRKEDATLLRGQGHYTDDLNVSGQAYAVMVRSPYAHGVIRGIDIAAAQAMPGVLAIITGQDLQAGGFGPIRCRMAVRNRDGTPMRAPPRPALPTDKVRFAGEAVACVIAETRAAARDAAEAVMLDIEMLPALVDAATARDQGAVQLHADAPGNVVLDFHFGNEDAVAAAFARAPHVVTQRIVNSRVVVNAMEPRAAIGEYDPVSQRWTLRTPSQGVMGLREGLARDVLGVEPAQVRVLTGSVGGSFGMKSQVYPEQVCLLHAARLLGRPVKWTDDRSESFLSDHHGRSAEATISLALDDDGHFLAVRLDLISDTGAFMVAPQTSSLNAVRNIIGPYRTPLLVIDTKAVVTTKTPVGAYRGAGRPEANYYMSRVIDVAAAKLGIDPIELRRRNLIPAITTPYKTAANTVYDSGRFGDVLDRALEMADWGGFAARQQESASRGRLRGRGISLYVEATGPQSKEMGGIRFDADGGVTMLTGTLDYGQGHASSFAQVLVDRLGIPFDRIRLLQGDSDALIAGGGTGGSKSMMSSGEALVTASNAVIEKARLVASEMLEAAIADIVFADGRFSIVGTDRGVDLMTLAASRAADISVSLAIDTPPSTFPNGCHIAEVEIETETGIIEVVRYNSANDFGVVINPLLVEGQIHGGVLQGIGQALGEQALYDSDGQMLTGSYMDYHMPRATDAPDMRTETLAAPATTNALGAKGCGEAGCAGALPSVMGAIIDALSAYGIAHIDMPATPERVWQAIRTAPGRVQ